MFKRAATLLLAAIMLFACGCSDKSEEKPEVNYTRESFIPGITMDIPEGYKRNEDNPEHPYYIKDATETQNFFTINLETEKTDATFNSYCFYAQAQYEKLDGYILLSQEDTEISGLPARIMEFRYDVEYNTGTDSLCCAAAILVDSENVYVASCLSKEWAYKFEKDTFLHCLRSLDI